jgi:hypothetical protein
MERRQRRGCAPRNPEHRSANGEHGYPVAGNGPLRTRQTSSTIRGGFTGPVDAGNLAPAGRSGRPKKLAGRFAIPDNAAIETDRILFRSILANLLSNAVEYSPFGEWVEIRWQMDAKELAITNTVQDLSPDDVSHLFERLWRKDKSRTGSEHCGLGLSLSRTFAELLGLRLTAHLSDRSLTLKLMKSE